MTDLGALRSKEDALCNDHNYEEYHELRYIYLLDSIRRYAPLSARILDIGRSPFIRKLEEIYQDVWTLGFTLSHPLEKHVEFDLNLIAHGVGIPCKERFDLIVFAEVVEHLHIPASAAFLSLRDILSEDGILIVQTPNAAEIMKRVALLRGRNPYEMLRLDTNNPGHFREYTMMELREAANIANLSVLDARYIDYFPRAVVKGFHPMRAVLDLCRNFVPSFRNGQTLILQKA